MLKIKCPECGKEVEPSEHICPFCGYPLRKPRPQEIWPDENPKRTFRDSITRNSVFKKYIAVVFCIIVLLVGFTVFGLYIVLNWTSE